LTRSSDPRWRPSNLYTITDKAGQRVPFGPTEADRWRPFGRHVLVVRAQDFGGNAMDAIPVDVVLADVRTWLNALKASVRWHLFTRLRRLLWAGFLNILRALGSRGSHQGSDLQKRQATPSSSSVGLPYPELLGRGTSGPCRCAPLARAFCWLVESSQQLIDCSGTVLVKGDYAGSFGFVFWRSRLDVSGVAATL
jgi:hypothetical protein